MVSTVTTAAICGIEARRVSVEADISSGLPCFVMVGFLGSEVKEAQDRVRTALVNSGFRMPSARVTVSLSPADLRKSGSWFDLPIAVAVLGAMGVVPPVMDDIMMAGELGLTGSVRPVRGIMEMVCRSADFGCRSCIIPLENLDEGACISGRQVMGAGSLREVIGYLTGDGFLKGASYDPDMPLPEKDHDQPDFRELKGQPLLRRAAEIAVSGFHNMLMIGPPGSGKSMTARRLPSIMPGITREEAVEITRIHSVAGVLPEGSGLITQRPFRAPHHTATSASFAGGGNYPGPGEISLAHGGILYLDELPLFKTEVLETLRQPLEEGKITICRIHGDYTFPAHFILAAAMNPCRCGFFPDRTKCRCTSADVRKYLEHISRPLLDRIDLCAETGLPAYEELRTADPGEDSASIRSRVEAARKIQSERYKDTPFRFNGDLTGAGVERYCRLGKAPEKLLAGAYRKFSLTGRGCIRVLKVARTIADLEGADEISCDHLAEALGYRMADTRLWQAEGDFAG